MQYIVPVARGECAWNNVSEESITRKVTKNYSETK